MTKKFKQFINEDYEYNGNITDFLQNLQDNEVNNLLDDILDPEDVDERMDAAERLCFYIEQNYPEFYEEVEDDIKDLAIG